MHRGNYVVLKIPKPQIKPRFSGYVERWLLMANAMRRGRTVKLLLQDPVYQALQLAQFARPWRFLAGALPTVLTIQRWYRGAKGLAYSPGASGSARGVQAQLKTFMSDFLARHMASHQERALQAAARSSTSSKRQFLEGLSLSLWFSVCEFLEPGEALVGIASAKKSMRVVFMRLSAQPGAEGLHLFRVRFEVSR